MALPRHLIKLLTDGDKMQSILIRKDLLVQITATLFLISGVVIAVHFGTFM